MKYLLNKEETNRLYFRLIEPSDFNSWIDFFKDPSSFKHWIEQRQDPEIECRKWYEKQENRYATDLGGMNALVEKSTENLIGYSGLLVQYVDDKEELEVAYSLLPTYRNKGYATEAARKCRDYAFKNNGADSVISIVSITNTPSANVAVKNGMRLEKQTLYRENQVNIFRIEK
ncbi:MAG: GNAT family N-acetyltransferase, partial [Chryseolinea sp.]